MNSLFLMLIHTIKQTLTSLRQPRPLPSLRHRIFPQFPSSFLTSSPFIFFFPKALWLLHSVTLLHFDAVSAQGFEG